MQRPRNPALVTYPQGGPLPRAVPASEFGDSPSKYNNQQQQQRTDVHLPCAQGDCFMTCIQKRLTHQCGSASSMTLRCPLVAMSAPVTAFSSLLRSSQVCYVYFVPEAATLLCATLQGKPFWIGKRLEAASACEKGASSGLWQDMRWSGPASHYFV